MPLSRQRLQAAVLGMGQGLAAGNASAQSHGNINPSSLPAYHALARHLIANPR